MICILQEAIIILNSSLVEPAEHCLQRGPYDELLCLIALYFYIVQSGGFICDILFTKISALPFCH